VTKLLAGRQGFGSRHGMYFFSSLPRYFVYTVLQYLNKKFWEELNDSYFPQMVHYIS